MFKNKTNIKTNAQSIKEGISLQNELAFRRYERDKQIELEESKVNTKLQDLFNNKSKEQQIALEYKTFLANTKKALLIESIYKLYEMGLEGTDTCVTRSDVLNRYGYVTRFVEEAGVDNLLNRFKTKTSMLSEFYNIIEEKCKKIKEEIDPKNPETFKIPEDDRDDFLKELESDEVEKVGEVINTRVKNTINAAIENNIDNKERIKQVMQDLETTLDENKYKEEEVKESFIRTAKQKMNSITNSGSRSIYEYMMEAVGQKAVTDEKIKEMFVTENKIDYNKVNNTVVLMYTFLETLNTAKIIDVDRDYIKTMCEQL